MTVVPTAGGYYVQMGNGVTWSNSGVANLSGYIYTGIATGDTETIVNQAGASFNLLNDAAGTNVYQTNGTFTNAGTLAKTGGTGTSHIYAAVTNTGTISATSGTLELDGGATLSGAIGSTTGGSVRLASTGTSSGTLTILDNSASVSFAVAASATLTNSGTVLDAGVFTVGTAGTTGSLTNAAGAVFNLTSNDASWSGNATVANAGTIAKTGGTGLSTISLAITNTGLIDAAVGTLRLNNTVNGASGTIRVDGGATLEITGVAASVGAKQTIAFNGAGATLKLDKPITFTLPLSGFGIGNQIDLVGQSVTSAVINGATLTVTPSVGSPLTYVSSASLTGDLVGLTSDGAGGTFVGLYRGAVAGAHTPEPLAFGSVHVGAAAIQAVGISNTAVADGYSEALDASLSTASTGFTVAGTLTGLGAGKSDSSTLKVTLKTATAGAVSGTATLALSSDGTGIDGRGITALASQTVNVTGAVYAFAQPSVPSPVVNLGVARVGGAALTGSASVVNTSVAPGYQESLIYAAGSTPASLSVSNGGGTIVAGGTASLGITLGTALAGDFTGTQVPVAMTSTGTGTSGLANTALTAGTLTANGKIYAPAVGQTSAGSIDLGVWHVGDSATAKTLGITNAATGALTDLLTAGTATLGGSYTGAVTETIAAGGIAPGGSGSVSFGLSTATAGLQTGTVTLGFGSHDADLTDIAAAGVPVTVTGAVDNYAISTPISVSGPALTGSGTSYVLNLGTVQIPGTAGVTNTVTANFGVQNSAAVLADLLSGGWTISGANVASFTNTGFVNFSGLGAGQSETAQSVGLSATSASIAGPYKETLVLTPTGSNASGYSGVLASETITVTGTLVSLTGQTITLTKAPDIATGGAGNDVFSAAGSTLNSRDQLDGAGGVNTLVLTGAGMYDLGAPKVLANIQVVTATEGQITGGGLADTTQTVYLRDGLDVTVNVAAGTPAAGNTQPESITIYGGTGNDIINLSTGKDTVVIGGTGEVVNGGSGTSLVQATAALSTAKVVGAGSGSLATTLELTTGGTATLNAATNNVTVKLDAATNLTLNSMQFITAIGQVAGNTLTAGASGQILGGTAGGDTLIGYTGFGTIFKGTSAGLSGDTIQNWGGTDSVDLTDMAFASLKALTYTAGTGNGVLTVKDGTHTDKLTFTGTFALHNFTAVSDGGTGTLINWHV